MATQRPATFEHIHDSSFEYTFPHESRNGRESSRSGEFRPGVHFGICDGLSLRGPNHLAALRGSKRGENMFRDWHFCLFGWLAAFGKGGKTKGC